MNNMPTPSFVEGVPGTFALLTLPSTNSAIQFSLPMNSFTSSKYNGSTQINGYTRFSFLVGPILLSVRGPWNQSIDALVMPTGLDPTQPEQWLVPSADGLPLHFDIKGVTGYTFLPYFEIGSGPTEPLFTNYPCF